METGQRIFLVLTKISANTDPRVFLRSSRKQNSTFAGEGPRPSLTKYEEWVFQETD